MRLCRTFLLSFFLPLAFGQHQLSVSYDDDADGRVARITYNAVAEAATTEIALVRGEDLRLTYSVPVSGGTFAVLLPGTTGDYRVEVTSYNGGGDIIAGNALPLAAPQAEICEQPEPEIMSCGEPVTIGRYARVSNVGDFATEIRGLEAGFYRARLRRDATNGRPSGTLEQDFELPDARPVWVGVPLDGATDRHYQLPFDGFSGFLEIESLDGHDLSGTSHILGNTRSANRPVTPVLIVGGGPIQLEAFMGVPYLLVSSYDEDILVQVYLASDRDATGQPIQAESLKARSAMVIPLEGHD
nr:hypothetical protein [Acidobacteriota bacterium]